MTGAIEELAGLVKKLRPGGITIPEALYGRARARLEALVEHGQQAVPFTQDQLVFQAGSCLLLLKSPDVRGDMMGSLRMRLIDTVRTATRCGAV